MSSSVPLYYLLTFRIAIAARLAGTPVKYRNRNAFGTKVVMQSVQAKAAPDFLICCVTPCWYQVWNRLGVDSKAVASCNSNAASHR